MKLDGRTPYERLRGREYRGEIAEGFETVHYKVASTQKGKLDPQSAIGVWLGKSLMSDGAEASGGGQKRRDGKRRPLKASEDCRGNLVVS